MTLNQVLGAIAGVLSIAALGYAVWQVLPKRIAANGGPKWKGAARIGLATWGFALLFLTGLELWQTRNQVSLTYARTFLLDACFFSPIAVVAFLGGYVRLTFMESFMQRKPENR